MDAADIAIRVGKPGDWEPVYGLFSRLFHHPPIPEVRELEHPTFEPERSLVAEDSGQIVGHALAYTRGLTVPGAIVPAAHVSQVGVAPTHRRRGLLTRLMNRQLTDLAAAGQEPVAVLWASESAIYPRFGYGHAAQRLSLSISTRGVRVKRPDTGGGRLRLVDPATDAQGDYQAVYERLRPSRVGWSSRDDRWWRVKLADPEATRDGWGPLYGVVHETADGPTGYATWRSKADWKDNGPACQVQITEVAAETPAAYTEIWNFLLSLDLVTEASFPYAALDEPLQHLVDEPRRLGATLLDALWIRIVDLPAALSARRYSAPLDVVLDVEDTLLKDNAGRWRLRVTPDGAATCTRTEDEPDISCTIRDLGASYLGAVSLTTLQHTGAVHEHTPDTVRRTANAFHWHRMPQPTEVF